jgi:hypothetical protein
MDFEDDKLRKIVVKKWEKSSNKNSGGKSGKKSSSKSSLPSGMRKGSIPAILYEMVSEGGATLGELAEPIAEMKDKEPKQVYGFVQRNLIRSVAKSVEIKATYTKSGDEADITFELAD